MSEIDPHIPGQSVEGVEQTAQYVAPSETQEDDGLGYRLYDEE